MNKDKDLEQSRENIEAKLSEQVHFLQTVIDAIPSPVFYKNLGGYYGGCNKAFETYIGLKKEQILGKSVYDVASPELAATYRRMDEELFAHTGVQVYEGNVVYADGSRHDVIFHKATYTNTDDEVNGLVGIMTDITERKKVEAKLAESTIKLQIVLDQVVQVMATIAETRDVYTAGHQKRVSELAVAIAKELELEEKILKSVQVASSIHDIGKIAVPVEILAKPNKLTLYELGIIRGHVQVGYDILKTIAFPWPIADIVYQHHERLDGSGYPQGLKENEILLAAKIIAVADVVEAMCSHRPYRPNHGLVQAITEISCNRGVLFDSDVVAACIRVFEKGSPYSIG
jgi:PAS domain S-box-containing protein/putative nucleotidyltransferase with HDIG domain